MEGFKIFYYFSYIFGVCPYINALSQKNNKFRKYFVFTPSIIILNGYIICLSSLFTQERNNSVVSTAVNWIQFIPNALAYVLTMILTLLRTGDLVSLTLDCMVCDNILRSELKVTLTRSIRRAHFISIFTCIGKLNMLIIFLKSIT